MLELVVQGCEFYNEQTNQFMYLKTTTLNLEHSLISLQAWEAKWHKPFLSDEKLTYDQIVSYIQCMTLNKSVDPLVWVAINEEHINKVNAYIEDPMTATWFGEGIGKPKTTKKINRRTVTAELLYYYMLSLNIPFECRKWHLNQLITLIKVCNEENSVQDKKVSKKDWIKRRDEINEMRKRQMNTTG